MSPQLSPPPALDVLLTLLTAMTRSTSRRYAEDIQDAAPANILINVPPFAKRSVLRMPHVYPGIHHVHTGRFLDHEWIDIPTLREFLGPDAGADASLTRRSISSCSVDIKIEGAERPVPSAPNLSVKTEPRSTTLPHKTLASVKIRTSYVGGREVLELSSDSEGEDSDIQEVSGELTRAASRSHLISKRGLDVDRSDNESRPVDTEGDIDSDDANLTSEHRPPAENIGSDGDSGLFESETVWYNPIKSYARTGDFEITQKNKHIKRIEYIDRLPSIIPQFWERTVIVVNLSDPKFLIKNPTTKELYTVDHLIRNAVTMTPTSPMEAVRAAPQPMSPLCPAKPLLSVDVLVAFAKAHMHLLAVTRYEVHPASRDAILTAQADQRRTDRNTPEQKAAIFKEMVSNMKCTAIDSNGTMCKGTPMMKLKPSGKSRRHEYFLACSGWTRNFQKGHRTHAIDDQVGENLLAKPFAGQLMSTDHHVDTRPCSRLIHPNIGLKQQFCSHAHIVDGKQVKAQIRRYPCTAKHSIYVPTDPSIRMALIIQNNTGHNHPMLPLTKPSITTKKVYLDCVESNGVVGATGAKTRLILKGKIPTAFAPALASKRVKRDIIRHAKAEKFPGGLGILDKFAFNFSLKMTRTEK
ncbi:hypothetical protein DFH07DRAFT_779367 [Mycena maculata]|uniref:Uncharacterized protein n=1 Tax=Mycena maculata TaxID=230809 RepID=A0AAD7MZD6_9AGAR|nr:hypothetical protein DFH07DRAFT_779367 [Mycena maculata]